MSTGAPQTDTPGSLVLRSGSVRLVPFERTHLQPCLVNWLSDPVVVRYSNQRFRQHSLQSCERYWHSFEGSTNGYWAIEHHESSSTRADDTTWRFVGTMTHYRNPQHGTCDIGVLLGEQGVWGRGVAAQAWRLLMAWLVRERGVRKITAGTLASNSAMQRLARAVGMEPDGVRRAQEVFEGQAHDIVYFAYFADAHLRSEPAP